MGKIEQKITEGEIDKIIHTFKIGKMPRSDGLGSEYQKTLKKLLPKLKDLFNRTLMRKEMAKSWKHSMLS